MDDGFRANTRRITSAVFSADVVGDGLAPDDRPHEEWSGQQVVDEGEVGIGVQFAPVDAPLENLPYRRPARR